MRLEKVIKFQVFCGITVGRHQVRKRVSSRGVEECDNERRFFCNEIILLR
jgi:hypothetical protein